MATAAPSSAISVPRKATDGPRSRAAASTEKAKLSHPSDIVAIPQSWGGKVRHHTKDKGDIGLACVMADLLKHDIQVALPVSEHLPFDLIAIHPRGAMAKVSVKYRVMKRTGVVTVFTRSSWNDRNGTHHRHHEPGDYDAVAIYCPDTDECYYLLASEFAPSGRTVRITSPRNNQMTGVCLARMFTGPGRLFDPSHPGSEKGMESGTGPLPAVSAVSAAPGACETLFTVCPGQESNPQSAI